MYSFRFYNFLFLFIMLSIKGSLATLNMEVESLDNEFNKLKRTDLSSVSRFILSSDRHNKGVGKSSIKPLKKDDEANGESGLIIPQITIGYLDLLKDLKKRYKVHSGDITKFQMRELFFSSNNLKADVTISLLNYNKPKNKTFRDAINFKVNILLNKIYRNRKSRTPIASNNIFKAIKSHRSELQMEIGNLCEKIILRSKRFTGSHYVFYHGHDNSLRLYYDILREIKAYENIQNLDQSNPLRDKNLGESFNTVENILSVFEEKAEKYALMHNLKLYDFNRGMGVGFAPDKIEFFRENGVSVNPNLFGNMNHLAECTLFYWLDSFNISYPNEVLIKKLLGRILNHLPEEKINERVKKYLELYNSFMKNAGGNLMQIFIHKSIVDESAYASWAKGIPVLLDKTTHKLATRSHNNRPVPILTDNDNQFIRPRISNYLDILIENPRKFIDIYSYFPSSSYVKHHQKIECLDRPQARLIVNPKYFFNTKLIKINNYTRYKIAKEHRTNYQSALRSLIKEDVGMYLNHLQKDEIKKYSTDRLTKLVKFINTGSGASSSCWNG